MKNQASPSLKEKDSTTCFTKVSMNLNQRSIDNVNKLVDLIGETNKTRVVSIALELTRVILEMKQNGEKFYSKNGKTEKEMTLII